MRLHQEYHYKLSLLMIDWKSGGKRPLPGLPGKRWLNLIKGDLKFSKE